MKKHIGLTILLIIGIGNMSWAKEYNVYKNNEESFTKKVAQLKINLEEAQKLAIDYKKAKHPLKQKVLLGANEIIIGDWYLFTLPEKLSIPLAGIYVNGMSGIVITVESEKKIFRNNIPATISMEGIKGIFEFCPKPNK